MSMKIRRATILLASMGFIFSTSPFIAKNSFAVPVSLSPDERLTQLAKQLKPISDTEWKSIAGTRTSEQYEIVVGDTLSEISKRLFGDMKYWPKIWALNHNGMTNPHYILPGHRIAFLSGTGSSLPALAIQPLPDSPRTADQIRTQNDPANASNRATEWKHLPHQAWENYNITMPESADKLGFEKESTVVRFASATGFYAEAFPSNTITPYIGTVSGSRSESNMLTLNDIIYIESPEDLQIGESYTVTRKPSALKSPSSDRVGYSYSNLAEVKILGMHDTVYIAMVTSAKHTIERGNFIIKKQKKIAIQTPIAGPAPIEGVLMIDKNFSTYTAAQHKLVFIDRGSDDGIKEGMVFRAYQHHDPSNDKKITGADFIIQADILVLQTSPNFSSGLVIRSLNPITEDSTVVLLTDVSDLKKLHLMQAATEEDIARDKELDDFDKVDADGLRADEKKELKQLEKWQKNPEPQPSPEPSPGETVNPTPSPEASPSATPSPEPVASPTAAPAPSATPEPEPPTAPVTEPPKPAAPEPAPSLPDAALPNAPVTEPVAPPPAE